MNENNRREIRGLFFPLLFLCLSIHIGLFGVLRIDLLPDVVGYYIIAETLRDWSDVHPVRKAAQWCAGIGGVLSLTTWLPGLWALTPVWAQTAIPAAGMAMQIVVLRQVFALLIALCRTRGRSDLARNGERFRQLYTIGGCVVLAGVLWSGALRGGVYVLQSAFTLSAAVYAANCAQAIFPEKKAADHQS